MKTIRLSDQLACRIALVRHTEDRLNVGAAGPEDVAARKVELANDVLAAVAEGERRAQLAKLPVKARAVHVHHVAIAKRRRRA